MDNTNGAPEKRLFLLDAYALIYRAYFAFSKNPRITTTGINTSAIFGFTNSLMEVLTKEKPTHMAVVFDTAAPTNRHETFTDYKANREAVPDDIIIAIPYIKKILEGFCIPVLESDGYEADDIIGTLAKKAEKEGFLTYMMTPDKDFGQLVSDRIFIFKPSRRDVPSAILGPKEVCDKYGIERPEQVIDILGLWGDAVDNIPGIPGVGEKTATQLIREYGSIENLLENTDKLKGKLKERVETNREQALMSKHLATIQTDVPVEFDASDFACCEPNKEVLQQVFAELEFRGLANRILGEETAALQAAPLQGNLFDTTPSATASHDDPEESAPPVALQTIRERSQRFHVAETEEQLQALASGLNSTGCFCFDTETDSLDMHEAGLVGLSFSWAEGEGWFVPVPDNRDKALEVVQYFKPAFENEQICKVGQNLKFDLTILRRYNVRVKGPLFDTMLAHYLLQPDMKHGMDALAVTYLKYLPISIEQLIGKKGKKQLSMRDVPLEQLAEYAAEDAEVTFRLKNVFEPLLTEVKGDNLFREVEMRLLPTLIEMEREGVRIDIDALKLFSAELEQEIRKTEQEIYALCGMQFNIASPRQLGEVLYNVLKIDAKGRKTRTGQFSTSEDVLQKMINKHPVIAKILEFRSLQKLKSTYVDSLPGLVNAKTGRIHTTYNQAVAATGRLSSVNPNLQNIPIRTEKGREVRRAFIPRDEHHVLFSADYSQIELRIMAALSKDEALLDAFNKGLDIHTATAAKIYHVDTEAVTKDMRRNAKMVNFGIIYGISAFGLAERLGIPRKEAAAIIEEYFREYSGVRRYMDYIINFAREHGYVETMLGRRRYLRDINSANAVVRGFAERNAINAPIQGTAADMIKIAMINIQQDIEKEGLAARMILQVHDELVFDTPEHEVDKLKSIVVERMKSAIEMPVPVVVETGIGRNWLDAH